MEMPSAERLLELNRASIDEQLGTFRAQLSAEQLVIYGPVIDHFRELLLKKADEAIASYVAGMDDLNVTRRTRGLYVRVAAYVEERLLETLQKELASHQETIAAFVAASREGRDEKAPQEET